MSGGYSSMARQEIGREPAYSLDFPGEDWRSPELLKAWEQMVHGLDNHDALFQTPEFFEHLHVTKAAQNLSLLALRDRDGSVAGVIPLQMVRWPLTFGVRGYTVAEANRDAVVVLGSQPLIPSDPVLYDHLFTTIVDAFPGCDAIAMTSVPTDSFLWRHCHESRTVHDRFLVYIPDGKQSCHTIPLPETFQEYLGKLSQKKRYNLRKQVRRLREFGDGRLELSRIDAPGQVRVLTDALEVLRRNPDSGRAGNVPVIDPDKFADLARRGMLLCYVLCCGQRPGAVAFGIRHEGIYRLYDFVYDKSLAALSPGSSMLFLMIEDLIRRRITLIDFGYGEPVYRHRSTNVLSERGTILLLRKTFANRLLRTAHETFRTAIILLKHLLRAAPHQPDGVETGHA
jgi:CelD/BcsL family acetyltransferase involved in cellulose biosynthesis